MATDGELALRYLGDCLYGALLGQAGAARPANLVRSLPQGLRVGVPLLRRVLEEDERFEEVAGRYDLADRETLGRRPFGGAVSRLLEAHGGPMPVALMVTGLTRLRRGSPEYFRELLDEFEDTREEIIYVKESVVDRSWLLVMEGDDEEALLFYNEMEDDDELRELWEECEERDLRKRDMGLTAANLLETFERPLGPRRLAFLTRLHHPQIFEPVEFVAEIIERDDVVAVGGRWIGEEQLEEIHQQLRDMSDELAGEGEEAPEVDIAAVLAEEPPDTAFKIDPEDRTNILSVVSTAQVPIGVDELIIDLLEIEPGTKRFAAAAHLLQEELAVEEGLLEVSPGRYMSRDSIPGWVHEVPEPLLPAETDADEDVLLELEGLPEELREEVLDPVYEDVGCGVEIEPDEDLLAEDAVDYPLLHHHYAMGTMAVRGLDRPVFEDGAGLRLLLVRDEEEGMYPAWVNLDLGLIYGLSRWYHHHLPPSGAVFTLARTDDPDVYALLYDGDTDEELAPDEERMNVLERKRERVSRRPISIFDLMVELLGEHEEGLEFNALWAEMNVVRRTSRWQIASLLTCYPCFEADGTRWTLKRELVREPIAQELEEFIIREEGDEEEGAEDAGEEDE